MPDITFIPPPANYFSHPPLSSADVRSQAMWFFFTTSPVWLRSNMLGPAGRRPVLVTFAHNLQMTALKLDRKHNRIGCRYNPGKGKQITYTYAYIKF